MALADEFESAQGQVKKLARTPNPSDLLQLYSLFKQASLGDVSGARPGMLDMRARAKFDAWSKRRGMDTAEAQAAYIEVVERLVAEIGTLPGPGTVAP